MAWSKAQGTNMLGWGPRQLQRPIWERVDASKTCVQGGAPGERGGSCFLEIPGHQLLQRRDRLHLLLMLLAAAKMGLLLCLGQVIWGLLLLQRATVSLSHCSWIFCYPWITAKYKGLSAAEEFWVLSQVHVCWAKMGVVFAELDSSGALEAVSPESGSVHQGVSAVIGCCCCWTTCSWELLSTTLLQGESGPKRQIAESTYSLCWKSTKSTFLSFASKCFHSECVPGTVGHHWKLAWEVNPTGSVKPFASPRGTTGVLGPAALIVSIWALLSYKTRALKSCRILSSKSLAIVEGRALF